MHLQQLLSMWLSMLAASEGICHGNVVEAGTAGCVRTVNARAGSSAAHQSHCCVQFRVDRLIMCMLADHRCSLDLQKLVHVCPPIFANPWHSQRHTDQE